MSDKNNIDLPPHVYTIDNLAESGIKFDDSVLDTAWKQGPSLKFWISLVLSLPLGLFSVIAFYFRFVPNACLLFAMILTGFLLVNAGIYLIKWILFICLRRNIRDNSKPIPIEPLAIVIRNVTLERFFNSKKNEIAFVYKEVGTKKPRFYISAWFRSDNYELPSKIALLYRDYKKDKYYTIDSEYSLITKSQPATSIFTEETSSF